MPEEQINSVQIFNHIEETKFKANEDQDLPENEMIRIIKESTKNMIPLKIKRICNLGGFKWNFKILDVASNRELCRQLTEEFKSIK